MNFVRDSLGPSLDRRASNSPASARERRTHRAGEEPIQVGLDTAAAAPEAGGLDGPQRGLHD